MDFILICDTYCYMQYMLVDNVIFSIYCLDLTIAMVKPYNKDVSIYIPYYFKRYSVNTDSKIV